MKLNLLFVFVLLLTGCTSQVDYNKVLVQADLLMQSRPDSALFLLEIIPPNSLRNKADSAYYALLLTQARDKNYIVQTDDSLVRKAVHYFDTTDDTNKQANAYYYWGNIYRDKGEYPTAINRYLIALSRITSLENYKLRSVLYSSLGYLYYIQGEKAEADSIYYQAEQFALQQADTIGLCYALIQRGMINLENGKEYYPKAEQQMKQALSIGKVFSDCTVLGPIYTSLSALYNAIPDTIKALQYSRLNYTTKKDTIHCYRTLLYLGNAYYLNGQYDSARIFLQKVLAADRYYDSKADACMRLSEIAQLEGKMELAISLSQKRSVYLDSARINQPRTSTHHTVIPYMQNSSKDFPEYYIHSIYKVLGFFFITAIWFILYLWKKNQRYKKERKEWEERLKITISRMELDTQKLSEQQHQRLLLEREVNQLELKKKTFAKEEYKISAIYTKVIKIAKELVTTDTKENLSEEEWSQFILLTNAGWNGIITYLNETYDLSREEIQICCLYLAQVPVKHMGHFLRGQVRSTIQLKSKGILQKIEAPQNMLLKNMLFLLAEKLENNK
nr:tetratricopeptide repeat protein [uncultured Bacteroides sp.]